MANSIKVYKNILKELEKIEKRIVFLKNMMKVNIMLNSKVKK